MASSPWSSQPFKALYIVGFWTINLTHLLFLSLSYTITPLRVVPQWSYKLSLGVAIAPAAMKPAPVGAAWHPAPIIPGGADTNRRMIVYAGGGAFVLGWDPEKNAETVSGVATEHFGATNVLYMQYRLASEKNSFPVAVQDFLPPVPARDTPFHRFRRQSAMMGNKQSKTKSSSSGSQGRSTASNPPSNTASSFINNTYLHSAATSYSPMNRPTGNASGKKKGKGPGK
ncbi:hypothetical protein F4819DRAFT_489226 [Hypoxylon fuscum]|nr:hypothetical protein F4819DRAFT_489226 [Hypoxylon fuscum]